MAIPGGKDSQLFSSTISYGSEEDVQLFCEPCDRNGPRRPAYGYCTDCEDHLCMSCFNGHRNVKPCRHHTLLDKDVMPKSHKLSSASYNTSHQEELTKPCQRHTRKMMEFYCHDHEVLLCSVCVTLEHPNSSCSVNYIPDISGQTVNSDEYKDIIKRINALLNQCQNVKTETKKITENSNTSLSNALKEMKKYRQEINEIFDGTEKEVENRAKKYQEENDSRLMTSETTCDDIYKSMKILKDTIEQLNISKEEEKLFVELQSAKEVLERNVICMNDLSNMTDITDYDFERNRPIASCLDNEISLGTIRPKLERRPVLAKQNYQEHQATGSTSFQLSHQEEINVKTSEDKITCCITGMTLPTPDQLVLADSENYCIKMVDINSKQIISQVPLSSGPFDVTSVSSAELAVTLPCKQKIQFISNFSNQLTKVRSLNVEGQCTGITSCEQKLVVSFSKPGKLQIFDIKGIVLATFRTTSDGKYIFDGPDYVEANSKFIFVSDYSRIESCVIILNWKGEEIGRYKDLNQAEGLAMTKENTVFVCDSKRYNLQKMSDTSGEVVLWDLISPKAVCWCDDTHTLFISSSSGEEKNFIRVISMQ